MQTYRDRRLFLNFWVPTRSLNVAKEYSPPQVDRIWLWVYYNKIPIYPIFYLLNPKSTPNHHLPHLNVLRLKVGEHVGGRAWGGWEGVSWKFANEFSLATSYNLFLVSLQYLRLVYDEPPPQGPLPSTS